MTLDIDRELSVPADARAVIVAQSLLSARYVQLSPGYTESGPTLRDGSVIPLDRTAVPVEWDEVKAQLTRLATELGPKDNSSSTSVSRIIDSTSAALDGNGEKLRKTLAELAGVGRILASGSGDIVDVLKNLQTFVAALRGSNVQIVEFEDRLATLSSQRRTCCCPPKRRPRRKPRPLRHRRQLRCRHPAHHRTPHCRPKRCRRHEPSPFRATAHRDCELHRRDIDRLCVSRREFATTTRRGRPR